MTVRRDEILDYVTYGERRTEIREAAMAAKELRRVIVGDVLTFLFENHETVRYQVLEMVRTERLVRESDIQHELHTYNELLGAAGRLGCATSSCGSGSDSSPSSTRCWKTAPRCARAGTNGRWGMTACRPCSSSSST